jgi:hypothetical protein
LTIKKQKEAIDKMLPSAKQNIIYKNYSQQIIAEKWKENKKVHKTKGNYTFK